MKLQILPYVLTYSSWHSSKILMSAKRNAWHSAFGYVLKCKKPDGVEIETEVQLTSIPQVADFLVIRKILERQVAQGEILRGLWSHLPQTTLMEFKSASSGFARGDWSTLLGYTCQYAANMGAFTHGELAHVLIVPYLTPSIWAEAKAFQWSLEPLQNGYYRIVPSIPFVGYVVVIDEVSAAEQDEFLNIFASEKARKQNALPMHRAAAILWPYLMNLEVDMQQLEGYDEIIDAMLEALPASRRLRGLKPQDVLQAYKPEERLQGLKPEERLQGLKPEERLQGLSEEERVLLLDDETLKYLDKALIDRFSPQTREKILARLKKLP